MHHHGGGANYAQHATHVDRGVHPLQRLPASGTGAITDHPRPRPGLVLVRGGKARVYSHLEATRRNELLHLLLDHLAPFSFGPSEQIAGRPERPRQATVEHQRARPLGVGRGEYHAHRNALGEADQRCPVRPGRIHHRPDVIASLLQRRQTQHPVRQAGTPLIEKKHPRMLGKTAQQGSPARCLPPQLHVGDNARHDDHVKRALTQHLVGDRDIPAARITGLRHPHANESRSPKCAAQGGVPIIHVCAMRASPKHARVSAPIGGSAR